MQLSLVFVSDMDIDDSDVSSCSGISSGDSYRPESDEETDDDNEEMEIDEIGTLSDVVQNSDSDASESAGSFVYPELTKTISIQLTKHNSKGNLDNKKHACVYCEKLYPNIARHLTNVHKSQHEVAKILILPSKSKQRRSEWQKLVNKGDHAHNYQVLDTKRGLIIPRYRSKDEQETSDYVFCYGCKAYYKKNDLWKHTKTCQLTNSSVKFRPIQAGKLMLPSSKTASRGLHENVLARMKDDEIKTAVLKDDTILHYGNSLCEEKGNILHHRTYISNKLRNLGRLLIAAKDLDSSVSSVFDLMKRAKWDTLTTCVKSVAGYSVDTNRFHKPTLATNLGHRMQRCAELEHFSSLKAGDKDKSNVTETFLQMYRLGWSKEISSKAHASLQEQKYNKPHRLPLVEDVVRFNKALESRAANLCTAIEDNPEVHYPELARVSLAQIILFNRKRSGEAQRMTIKNFVDAKKGGEVDETIKKTLSKFEQKLCETHLRVEIKGKKQRRVPVLLTQQMLRQLNTLLKYRRAAKVEEPVFIFARPGKAEFPYRGSDCLREFAFQSGLKRPESVTSTKLRKQLATLAQLLNLKENNQDLVAAFQGHDIRVHREYYRLPESTLQIAKVSKLLHCINEGTIDKYRGMDLDDIDLQNTGNFFLVLCIATKSNITYYYTLQQSILFTIRCTVNIFG